MTKITIINKNTIAKRLSSYVMAGLIDLVAYSGIGISRNISEHLKYSSRRESVEELIKEGKLDEAESVLGVFANERGLEKLDLEALSMTLKVKRKNAKISELDKLIDTGYHSRALEKYSELTSEGILSVEQSAQYTQKLNEISIEGRLNAIKQTYGEGKINNIEALFSKYPDYERADELRVQQFKEYLSLITTSFLADIDEEKMFSLLKGFNSSLRKQEPSKLNNYSFGKLFETGDKYFSQRYNIVAGILLGDRVETVKKLGELSGRGKDEYYAGHGERPLHSKGVVTQTGVSNYPLYVKFEDGEEESFAIREVKKIDEEEKWKEALQQFLDIRNYLSGLIKQKVEEEKNEP